jgi:hypothetical protein
MTPDNYRRVLEQVRKAEVLEKHAAQNETVLATKVEFDRALFDQLKEAGAAELLQRALAHPVGRGAAYGLGATIPAAGAGALLINQAGRESRKSIEDARNKALQAALGVGLVGGGLYGLHRMTSGEKRGNADTQELLEKLATVGYLDEVLEDQVKHAASTEVRVEAQRCYLLNAEHGIDILKQLLA